MNFSDFQKFREQTLGERPGVLDCAATNLYSALARLIPPQSPAPEVTVHRCHLATEWAECFGGPPGIERRALISCGVRDSLALLFGHYAHLNALVWLPSDNYPVYAELARAAQIAPLEFPTIPEPAWPDAPPCHAIEILLITNPLKPLGRWLTERDVSALTSWLAQSPRRRLVLDAVYTFDTRFHPTTVKLLATGQTILLHSLTKSWLHPRLVGIALVPESDLPALTPLFRAQPPPQSNLARARELMLAHAGMPAAIAAELASARERLFSALPPPPASERPAPAGEFRIARTLPELPEPMPTDASGYFTAVRARWQDLLENENVLGLPATVFGSQCEDITILSSLSFLRA